MYLYELTAYAERKYSIAEEHKWKEFPTFSVLTHPVTGKWVALLMRQWDTDRGEDIELCDLRCGREYSEGEYCPYISAPFRMRGPKWTGVRFGRDTEPEVIFRMFDRAIKANEERGYTIVLGSEIDVPQKKYTDTPIPFSRRDTVKREDSVPDKIREMQRMYRYGDGSFRQKCLNFRAQAKFMEDYEDDASWELDYTQYFPTYRDLRPDQLRGYFAWRTQLRKGNYLKIAASLAYIYIYELINLIGASSPGNAIAKMAEFEKRYIDSGLGDDGMRKNLRNWMFDTAVVHGLPQKTAAKYADPVKQRADHALMVLHEPYDHGDAEVFEALCEFAGEKWKQSPVIEKGAEEGVHLFTEVWRYALTHVNERGRNLFRLCFGDRHAYRWYPYGNAVFGIVLPKEERTYDLSSVRRYICSGGMWKEAAYHKVFFDLKWIKGLMHEADRQLRQYLKAGRNTKPKEDEAWATSVVAAVIEADRIAKAEAARPKVEIKFQDLDRIREESYITRDSLLTEEDIIDDTETVAAISQENIQTDVLPDDNSPETGYTDKRGSTGEGAGLLLTDLQREVLKMVLNGEPVKSYLVARHEMPEITADSINEILFDEIGDSVVECDGDEITLVEDYREDVMRILGDV